MLSGKHGFTPKVIWAIVKANAKSCGLPSVAPHDHIGLEPDAPS
jgi:hypothetical protein